MLKPRKCASPSPDEVKRVRECVQAAHGLGITAGQDWCADALHTSRRAFQQWEAGDRPMHAAFWELLKMKTVFIAHK